MKDAVREDEVFMKRALLLAARAEGRTRPNPMVGAVVVKGGRIIGEGFHRKAGEPHAEVVALSEAGKKAGGASLYVTMEPCCHWGRTPPCTEAILARGIRRVVIGSIDPNPLVSGKGIRHLRKFSVKTTLNVLSKESRRLNEAYITFMKTGRPFVVMKAAISADGCIATADGESRWISGEKSREFVHGLRARADAVMVGVGTVLSDDPMLTVRYGKNGGASPYKVIVDSALRIPEDAGVLRHEPWKAVVATTGRAPRKKRDRLMSLGAQVLVLPSSHGLLDLSALVRALGRMNIQEVLVEGGARLFASCMEGHIVNKAFIILAPVLLGEGTPLFRGWDVRRLTEAPILKDVRVRRLGNDLLLEGYPQFRQRQV